MKKILPLILLLWFSNEIFAQCNPNVGDSIRYLCKGSNLVLKVSPGFNSYTWSNGKTGDSILVEIPGVYSVKVTGPNNCVVIKSVTVLGNSYAKFNLSGTIKCDSSTYLFTNQSNLPLTAIQRFVWDFGDDSSYQSSIPPNNNDLTKWSSFNYTYKKNGYFNPRLSIYHFNQNCPDYYEFSESKKTLPGNFKLEIDIQTKIDYSNNKSADSVCFATPKVCLFNRVPLNPNMGISFMWDFADFNEFMGFDKSFNQPEQCYNYKSVGQFFPTLQINCPGLPAKTFHYFTRVDTVGTPESNYNPVPISSPNIYSAKNKFWTVSDSISKYRIIKDSQGNAIDSINFKSNWFTNNPSDINKRKSRNQLKGFGINILGPVVKINDINNSSANIKKHLEYQCGPDLPVEFVNNSSTYQTSKFYLRWDFSNKFAPACTSFSVPNPQALNNGNKPYTSALDLNNRTFGKFISKGNTYIGRMNCRYSYDSLPIHQFENWTKIYKWFLNGHDFPPYDSSSTGWTKNPSFVSPGGKKLVQTIDTATWGKPLFSAGPQTTRVDTISSIWPIDILPNTRIECSSNIPDPIAYAKGFWQFSIPAGTSVDSNGFLSPALTDVLPDGTNRSSYKGNSKIPGKNKTLYEYFFDRNIASNFNVVLLEKDSSNACSNEVSVDLPLVKPDAMGLGIKGIYCGGLYSGGAEIVFNNSAGNPGVLPAGGKRTFIYFNYDSLLDRRDNTPCNLDGFVSWDGKSPLTNSEFTPGGLKFKGFYNYFNFNPNQAWTSANGVKNFTHYQLNNYSDYSVSPKDKRGTVTVGLIIGNGCATPACNQPACISDTIWYHNFFRFITLNPVFTYNKTKSNFVYGVNGKLPSQDFYFDTIKSFKKSNTELQLFNNYKYKEPFSSLFSKGDIIEFTGFEYNQEFIESEAWDWGDGTMTVDSFYYNKQDTFVKLFPSTSNELFFFEKFTYPYQRIRYEFDILQNPPKLISQSIPYIVGAKVLKTVDYDTVWRCDDLINHIFAPIKINKRGKIIDSAFLQVPIKHQYKINSSETYLGTYPNVQKQNDITRVLRFLSTVYDCKYVAVRYFALGVMDTFIVKEGDKVSDGKIRVGQSVSFVDSVRYWNPKSQEEYDPYRPIFWGENELNFNENRYALAMQNYPLDSIKVLPNPTRRFNISGTTCPNGWVWSEKVFLDGTTRFCTKLDTFFYERLYWDFESNGTIDAVGSNPTHIFNQPGNYIVSLISRDSVGYFDTTKTSLKVEDCSGFNPFPVNLASCDRNELLLEIPLEFKSVKWYFNNVNIANSENSIFINTNKEGWYKVIASIDTLSCKSIDSVHVSFLSDVKIKQGRKLTYCSNGFDSLILEPTKTGSYQFFWNSTQINQPKFVYKNSTAPTQNILKIVSQGAECFDTINVAFVEPVRLNTTEIVNCIKDSIVILAVSNPDFGSDLKYLWARDSVSNPAQGASSKLFIYDTTGLNKITCIQNFEQCADTIYSYVFAQGTNSKSISGRILLGLGDTANYTVPYSNGSNYLWKINGGTIQNGQGTNSVQVLWGNQIMIGNLGVIETNLFSCADSSSLNVSIGNVGFIENVNSSILIYPNPAKEFLVMSTINQELINCNFSIFDVTGRKIYEKTEINVQSQLLIDLNLYPKGLYFLKIESENSNRTFRFIKD